MNKTLVAAGYFALVLVAILVVTLIILLRPDASATIINFVGTTLAIAVTSIITLNALGKQNEKIAEVKTQTNGTLSALREENTRLTAQLLSVVGNTATRPAHSSEDSGDDPL
jgi:hypothetical protein